MNTLKTTFLLTALTLILVLAGEYFGGSNGALTAFVIAAAMNFFSYFYSDKLALAMYRAQPVTREELPRVYAQTRVDQRLRFAPALETVTTAFRRTEPPCIT